MYLPEFGHTLGKEPNALQDFLDEEDALDLDIIAGDIDPYSGWPSNMAEQIVKLLQAGFIPCQCSLPATLIKALMQAEVTHMTTKPSIPIKQSAEVFAVPGMTIVQGWLARETHIIQQTSLESFKKVTFF